jgi:carbamoyl-phosphate synthase small subunit
VSKSEASINGKTTQGHPERGLFFTAGSNFEPAELVLADGSRFAGLAPSWQPDSRSGEVVFNTGMTGYVETLTDPSYSGQILTFTYPLIGNYGVMPETEWESAAMHLRGVVVSELTSDWSHAGSTSSLLDWLRTQEVPVITGVDTRSLTKHLRTKGTIPGAIVRSGSSTIEMDPIEKVSVAGPRLYGTGPKRVIAVDCGMKENIVRSLLGLGVQIKRVPHDYDYTAEPYDAILLSNGPGDPTDYPETVSVLSRALKAGKPVFGICLGTQLLALAAGASTYKLLYGHRGHNQPVITPAGRAYITSQNHGYAINEASLPSGWRVSFRNLNDGSIEGIEHESAPFSAVQFHPEAAPGPTDTAWLFEKFGKLL